MAAEVGSAYVTLVPSARGFAAKMQKELSGDVARAGRSAGDDYGDQFNREASSTIKGSGRSMFKGLAGMAAGALAGVGIGQFIGDALGEARDAVVVGARTSNVIKSMGNAANISATQVADLAGKLSNKTAVDDEVIQSGQNLLLTFGNIRNEVGKGNDIFNQASTYMVDMAQAMGTDTKSAALQLGKALNDPVKGVTALTRSGVSFTQQQKDQIAAMQESGNMLGAQKVILGEVKKQFGGAGAAMATPAERAKVAWGNFQESVGTAIMPAVDRLLNKVSDFLPVAGDFAAKFSQDVKPALATAKAAATGLFSLFSNNQTTVKVLAGAITALVVVTKLHALSMALASGATKKWLLQTKIAQAATKAWAAVQWLLNAAMSANPIGLIVLAVAALVAAVVLVVKKLGGWDAVMRKLGKAWQSFKATMTRAWDAVRDAVVKGVDKVVTLVKGLPGKASKALSSLGAKLKALFDRAWTAVRTQTSRGVDATVKFVGNLPGKALNALRSLGSKLKATFTKAWDSARTAVSNGVDSVVEFVRRLPERIGNLGSKFLSTGRAIIGKFVDGMQNAAGVVSGIAGNVWDTLQGLINGAIDRLNAALEFTITIPGPDIRINAPNIPHLASGARVTGGTLALIGEGAEAETVLPDSLLRGLLERTAANAAGGQGQVGHLTITNWRDGTGFFRLVADSVLADEAGFRRDLGAMNA